MTRGILTTRGINVQRRVFSSQTDRDDEYLDQVGTASGSFLKRAVVVDVIFDPPTQIKLLLERFNEDIDAALLRAAPRNSILARVVSQGVDKRDQTPLLFYPTLSHTHQPLKPGEHVWVFFESDRSTLEQGFWLSRIVEPRDVDDPNFTHADRKFSDQREKTTVQRLEEEGALAGLSAASRSRLERAGGSGPRFPNGGDTEASFTLAGIDDYERIAAEADAGEAIVLEPVPRFSKRPADWVAEGSNNSVIVLGTDRTGAPLQRGSSALEGFPETDKRQAAGMFDIVAGRGTESPTSAKEVTNARRLLETDKQLSGEPRAEGDPDFENDAARLYGAMDTDVDANFGKPLPKLNGGAEPVKVSEGPVVVAKSDHVRVIAREDGTIRIVKEGDENVDRAVIIIEPDGTIMIDGPKVILGSGIEKAHGAGGQVFLGRDASESIVLGDTLRSLLDEYTTKLNVNIDAFATALQGALPAFVSPPGNFGNLGAPVPGVIGIATALISASATLKASVLATTNSFKAKTNTILSKNGKTK